MNYLERLQKLQQGGGIEDQVAQLVQAAMQGDQQANDQINQIMQAAQQGDQQAQLLAQLIQQIVEQLQGGTQQTEAMKCGGKLKTKVKKEKCGGKAKKKQDGGEVRKAHKVCPCTLKKVGGKLIEINSCTGLPIAKNGMKILRFEEGGNPYPWYDPRSWFNPGTEIKAPKSQTPKSQTQSKGLFSDNGFPEFSSKESRLKYIKDNASELKLNGYDFSNYSGTAEQNTKLLQAMQKQKEGADWKKLDSDKKEEKTTKKQEKMAQPTQGGVFSGTALAGTNLNYRKKWVADNADYLRSLGWSDARINGYQGSASDNLALKAGMPGFTDWRAAHPTTTASQSNQATQATQATQDPYTRNTRGVYMDKDGKVDWTRSVNPEAYRTTVMNEAANPYKQMRQTLRNNYGAITRQQGINAYWQNVRNLNQARRADRQAARQLADEYEMQYANNIINNLNGTNPTEAPLQMGNPSTAAPLQIQPRFNAGSFKEGGLLKYSQYLSL